MTSRTIRRSGPDRRLRPRCCTCAGAPSGGGWIDAYADGFRRAGVTDVRPHLIDGAGHFPHEEAAAATWRAISGFISGTPAVAARAESEEQAIQLAVPEPE